MTAGGWDEAGEGALGTFSESLALAVAETFEVDTLGATPGSFVAGSFFEVSRSPLTSELRLRLSPRRS